MCTCNGATLVPLQALWGNYTAAMDELGGFNSSVPVYVASGLLTYLSLAGAELCSLADIDLGNVSATNVSLTLDKLTSITFAGSNHRTMFKLAVSFRVPPIDGRCNLTMLFMRR